MLKITLQKEKPNQYFASVQGIEWVYAQGETSRICLENLESVLREVLSLRIEGMNSIDSDAKKLEMTF
jgi:predicted RNase H-like HicB family nuclease